jgi:solute carrier family 34 (sodium-dependent phosphate cotransporter)
LADLILEEHSITQALMPRIWDSIRITIFVVGALLLFLFSLDLMISSFQHLDEGFVRRIIRTTASPLTALFIGLLLTAMMQSSSVTTALAVAMVGAGSLTLQSAVPIIMGANIGTTITSTIISLGFINKKKELKRAVSAGTYHCFFNLLTALILFPLEYYYRFLSSISNFVSEKFYTKDVASESITPIKMWLDPFVGSLVEIIPAGIIMILGFFLVLASIFLFRKFISELLSVKSPQGFSRFFFQNQGKSFLWGIITTAAIRSSTITTSVVVPIVAKKITNLQQAAPFIMGANVGTTITAFIAAFLYSNNQNAVSIAIAHLLFNLLGVLIFFPIPALQEIPIRLSQALGNATVTNRWVGFLFLFFTFFFIPFLMIFLNLEG